VQAERCRARVALSFDNLGEAADEELGETVAPGPHYSVTEVLPKILELLAATHLKATFFVEAVNTERYPQALSGLSGAGHELGCHGWRHETFAALTTERKREILEASTRALRATGAHVTGFRPPGGVLEPDDLPLLKEAGLDWASPAGAGVGQAAGVVCLPFSWPLIDAYFLAPALAPLRLRDGLPEAPVEAELFGAAIERAIDNVVGVDADEPLCLVLHPFLYTSEPRLSVLADILQRLGRLRSSGRALVGPGREIAHDLRSRSTTLPPPALDASSWAASDQASTKELR
jgi:peptidoglycan/xylan/chitin deacetylase (PgdA/CDA1 family)